MAVTSSVLLNNRMRYVIQLFGTVAGDSATVTTTSLTRSDETTSTAALRTVNICYALANTPDNGTLSGISIRRGTDTDNVVLVLHGTSEYPNSLELPQLTASNTSSIFVRFGAPGMLTLDLRKVAGFIEPLTNVGV
jgi:hypothetical protein